MTTIAAPATRGLGHTEAMDLQAAELERTLDALRAVRPADWARPTDCPEWDVCRMYLHVLGACEAGASTGENARQLLRAFRHRRRQGGPLEAALSHVQVAERLELGGPQLVERLTEVAPRCVRGRRRTPAPVRRLVRLPIDGPVHETWTLGYLLDTIYLRDLWMHRVDLHRATGTEMELTADHDGRIVADVVGEWSRRHGRPFVLALSGPAGGAWAAGAQDPAAERHSLDAVEFCRILAGRSEGTGLLATIVPF